MAETDMNNTSKRILHFLKTGNYSGAENVAITIIVAMRDKYGYEGIYVSISGEIDDILAQHGIEHALVKSNNIREYQRIINYYHPDVIHAHDFGTSVILAGTKNNALMISHLHSNPLWIKRINFKTIMYICASKKYKYILGVSDSIFKGFVFGGLIYSKLRIVGNPIECKKIEALAQKASERDKSDVLFLGRLSVPKNPLRFLEIVKLCQKEINNIKVLMIGKGELEDKCIEKITQLALENNVELLGFKKNPYGFLKNTKVLCVPSAWEGFGLVVVEAFALGIPVVATPVGGMNSIVTEESGKLCESNEIMKEEIIKLLQDNQYYQQKSEGALLKAKEMDNVEKYIELIHNTYQIHEE